MREIVKELPWLGRLLDYKILLKLSEALLMLAHHAVSLSDNPLASEFIGDLLMSPYFYDNCPLQQAFCFVAARNIVQVLQLDAGMQQLVEKLIDSDRMKEGSVPSEAVSQESGSKNEDMESDNDDDDDDEMSGKIEIESKNSHNSFSAKEKDKYISMWEDFITALCKESVTRSRSAKSAELCQTDPQKGEQVRCLDPNRPKCQMCGILG